jgi:hypothetical protein
MTVSSTSVERVAWAATGNDRSGVWRRWLVVVVVVVLSWLLSWLLS